MGLQLFTVLLRSEFSSSCRHRRRVLLIQFLAALVCYSVLDKNKLCDYGNCKRWRNDFSSSGGIVDIYKLCSNMISTRAMCFCYYFMSGTVSRIPDPTTLPNKKNGIINDIPYESLMHVGWWGRTDRRFPSFYSFVRPELFHYSWRSCAVCTSLPDKLCKCIYERVAFIQEYQDSNCKCVTRIGILFMQLC